VREFTVKDTPMTFSLDPNPRYSALSLADLIEARDQFHVHLMHKANVVGTAVGKYLIRKGDPLPGSVADEQASRASTPVKSKGKRTLENSGVRKYSWPCVIVFVSEWLEEDEFANQPNAPAAVSDFVPKTIFLRDGRRVPVCVVEAPLADRDNAPPALEELRFPSARIGGGYPVIARVQQADHVASVGCLVTDGHLTYALTSRHVAGEPGEELFSIIDGERLPIGRSSSKQLRRAGFEDIYREWPGKNVFVNMDVGLIEVLDERLWTTQIYGVGALGQLADLSTFNLTLDIIGCPVRAFGCASGALSGQISALFYRFKAVGGFEYVADFLIGSRTDEPLATREGDSGTVWVIETGDPKRGLMPIATQWGGSVFSAGPSKQFPFALATNLSNVFQLLDVDLMRDRNVGSFNYWGPVGHYTIGSIACDLVEDAKLKKLMGANKLRISFAREDINADSTAGDVTGFVPLANVPDVVWKQVKTASFPAGRKGFDNPTHYADMDETDDNGNTLFDLVNSPADLTVELFQEHYDSLGHNESSKRGLLPFRVWQFFNAMVESLRAGHVDEFVCAAGILAHYGGDACQVLHGSYLADGDPARPRERTVHHRDGTSEVVSEALGKGVHSAYESKMLNNHIDTFMGEIGTAVGLGGHGLPRISTGQEAGFAIVELMRRTRNKLDPMAVVETFAEAKDSHQNGVEVLWQTFHDETRDAIADGCRVLAMIWDSAWHEGNGQAVADTDLKAVTAKRLKNLYSRQDFVPSLSLNRIGEIL
jgi:hypothetical protein